MVSVVGLDLSFTSTGIATAAYTRRVETLPRHGDAVDRSRIIYQRILDVLEVEKPDLVVVEAPSFASVGGASHERGYLWWRVKEAVSATGVAWKSASPNTLKLYATGSGKADKDAMMLAAARRFPWFAGKNDEADALWACALGYDSLDAPLVALPQLHRAALDRWLNPKVKAATKKAA